MIKSGSVFEKALFGFFALFFAYVAGGKVPKYLHDRYVSTPFANVEEFAAELESHQTERDNVFKRLQADSERRMFAKEPGLATRDGIPLLAWLIREENERDFGPTLAASMPMLVPPGKDRQGQSVIHYAARSNRAWYYLSRLHEQVAFSGGLKPDSSGRNAWHYLAERDDYTAARLLWGFGGFEHEELDKDKNTPLGLAITHGDANSVGLVSLLARESHDFPRDATGRNALLLAVDLKKWHHARIVADAGCDPDLPDSKGRTTRKQLKQSES